jgi:hypothetical protein
MSTRIAAPGIESPARGRGEKAVSRVRGKQEKGDME